MGMIRRLTRLFLLGLSLLMITFAAVSGWTAFWPEHTPADAPQADAIVCLAAGLERDGTLGGLSRTRTQTCIDLYHAGKAPLVAFTGGNSHANGAPTGRQMADMAISQGVPARAVVAEETSESTLQNALFTLPMIAQAEHLILVTHPSHLPRAWASFRWAGAGRITLHSASPDTHLHDIPYIARRETMAIWFNILRAPLYTLAGLLGVDDAARIGLLH